MWKWALAVTLLLIVGLASIFLMISRPVLLSFIDGWSGGGKGVIRSGGSIAFGTHGQRLDLWRPAGEAKKWPVIIFWYGGSWVDGDRRGYSFAARALTKEGFVVVVPDYRKVPEVRFPAFLEDGAEAIKWVRDHVATYGGDPESVAIMGHSAGAHTVAMLALDRKWLDAEGVDPSIIKAAVGISGPYDFYPFTSDAAKAAMEGVSDPQTTQPIHFARADAPPMLLLTSDADDVVRAKNAIALEAKLNGVGAPVQMINYPGLSHADMVAALSVPYRDKGPILRDSITFIRRAFEQE